MASQRMENFGSINIMRTATSQSLFKISQLLSNNTIQTIRSSARLVFPYADAYIHHDGSLCIRSHGLIGVNAPLPYAYCEWVQEQGATAKNDAPHHFIDMLSHGIIKKDISAWQLTRPAAIGERPWLLVEHLKQWAKAGNTNTAKEQLQSHFHGQINQGPITHEALKRVIGKLTGLPCYIKSFALTRHWLSSTYRSRLISKSLLNSNNPISLGKNTFLGKSMWQRSAGIEIALGPCTLEQAVDFSNKHSRTHGILKTTLRHFLPSTLSPICKLIVQPPPPPMRLGQQFCSALGANSMLGLEKKAFSTVAFKL